MFGTRVPQDAQIGVLNRLAFDSAAQTNWCCSEAIPVSEWIAAQSGLGRGRISAPAQAGSCGP